jgi:GT2 family glycosyltransferase
MADLALSIVIVSWNNWEYLAACLDSIFKQEGIRLEVILVDNHSSDRTIQNINSDYPQIKLIANSANLAYARACNQGMKEASEEYILLLAALGVHRIVPDIPGQQSLRFLAHGIF